MTVNNTSSNIRYRAELTAAVLAGGNFLRMGQDKAFIRWKGQRLIEYQVELLRRLNPVEVWISGRTGVNYGIADTRVVFDEVEDCGPMGGLFSLLRKVRTSRVLVLAVDMPHMEIDVLQSICAACDSDCGMVPLGDDGWEPLAAIYPVAMLPLLESRLKEGEFCLQSLVATAHRKGWIDAWEIPVNKQGAFRNYNMPTDLEHAPAQFADGI